MADTEQILGTFDDNVTANYDILMAKAMATLDTEYDKERIVGDRYAMIVGSLIKSTIDQSIEMAKQEILLDEQEELLQKQIDKLVADKLFVETQTTELTESVNFNNKIKALDSMGDMIGTMGAGSLTITEEMWTFYFNMIRELVSTRQDFINTWDANANTPDISATTPTAQDFYVVTVAGTTSLDGIANWIVGDIAYYDGYAWRKDLASPADTTISTLT